MIKQFAIIFSLVIFICAIAFAQENPVKEKDETQVNSELKSEQTSEKQESVNEMKVWNKVCPVKGNPVEDDSPTVEYNGKLYGFCCPGCDAKFEKNPEKYSKNLSEDGTKFIGRK
jgi:YHS domain-containing protein